jgi:hypothetical protein
MKQEKLKNLVISLKDAVGRFDYEVIVEGSAKTKRILKLLSNIEDALCKLKCGISIL